MANAPSLRFVLTTALGAVTDVVAIGLWTLLLTLLALAGGWSWLQFSGLLFLGIGCYVLVTPSWSG